MAEYGPCPWCGADVTSTPPLKVSSGNGPASKGSQPELLWDRKGRKHSERSCPGTKEELRVAR
jgi:hypothetical protein